MNFDKLPDTPHRVLLHTNYKFNRKIRGKMIERLEDDVNDDDTMISQRIHELNQVWDTERVFEAGAACMAFAGAVLGLAGKKSGWLLTGVTGACLLNHALVGWCPPMRMIGVRTSDEIYNEKTVLKEIRGDFSQATTSVPLMLEIAERQ